MTRVGSATDLVVRAFNPAVDLRATAKLICDVNAGDELDWFPTVAQLAVDWAPSPGFDPPRDVVVVEAGDRLVAAAAHEWRERDAKIVHRIELWVRPEFRRPG